MIDETQKLFIAKQDFINSQLDWFAKKLDDSFAIDLSTNKKYGKILYGHNGLGKTTLTNIIRSKYNGMVDVLSYTDNDLLQASGFDSDNTTLYVGPHINELDEMQRQLNRIERSYAIEEKIKSVGLNKTNAKKLGLSGEYNKLQSLSSFSKIDCTEFDKNILSKMINNYGSSAKIIITYQQKLCQIADEENELANFKLGEIGNCIERLSKLVDNNSTECPVCGSRVQNLISVMAERQKQYEQHKSAIIKEIESKKAPIDRDYFNKLVKGSKEITENRTNFLYFLACGANQNNLDTLIDDLSNIRELNEQIEKLKSKQKEFLNNIKSVIDDLESDLSTYFGANVTIEPNGDSEQITIDLHRKFDTFSTGEQHFLEFIVSLYNFIGSDRKIVILDDPFSSCDLPYQYKIAFEIVATANINHKTNKNVLIFTHSLNLLNTINSQHPGKFEAFYLDQVNDKLRITKLDDNGDANIINAKDVFATKIDKKLGIDGFFEALKAKDRNENIDCGDFSKEKSTISDDNAEACLHYELDNEGKPKYFKNKSNLVSGQNLANIIEQIDNNKDVLFQQFGSFDEIAAAKEIALVALRCWVEKRLTELWNLVHKNTDQKLIGNTFGEKVSNFFNSDDIGELIDKTELSKSKKYILSKKVMLNQASHYSSQLAPIEYAMSVSIDDILKEVKSIKNKIKDLEINIKSKINSQGNRS